MVINLDTAVPRVHFTQEQFVRLVFWILTDSQSPKLMSVKI